MKNFFKFGCLGIIGIIVVIIILAVVFSGGEEDKVSTGTDSKATESDKTTKAKDDGAKTINASNQNVNALGLNVGLGEVKVSKDKVQVGINVNNTTDKLITFYPDQGSAVIGDMQLDANMFLTDGDVSGDIQGGVKKEAVLEFLAPEGKEIDVKNIKEIKFMFGDVYDDETIETKDVSFTVPVK